MTQPEVHGVRDACDAQSRGGGQHADRERLHGWEPLDEQQRHTDHHEDHAQHGRRGAGRSRRLAAAGHQQHRGDQEDDEPQGQEHGPLQRSQETADEAGDRGRSSSTRGVAPGSRIGRSGRPGQTGAPCRASAVSRETARLYFLRRIVAARGVERRPSALDAAPCPVGGTWWHQEARCGSPCVSRGVIRGWPCRDHSRGRGATGADLVALAGRVVLRHAPPATRIVPCRPGGCTSAAPSPRRCKRGSQVTMLVDERAPAPRERCAVPLHALVRRTTTQTCGDAPA